MYRKVFKYLDNWKNSKYRKPLIIQGARQVGKTYAVLEFGKKNYDNVAYFNFQTNQTLAATFDENISPSYLIPILSHISGQSIFKEHTLIVFDEVQLCEGFERVLNSVHDEELFDIYVTGYFQIFIYSHNTHIIPFFPVLINRF